jgi:peptidoglycan/LPS O-acetylase OafA/YrhL
MPPTKPTTVPLIDRLRRRTIAEKYIPAVDGLRFAAILSVVLLHIAGQEHGLLFSHGDPSRPYSVFLQIAGNGARGVPIFFAISGFILALPFARHRFHDSRPVSLSFYFLRRLTRLEPPYLLTLLIRLPLLMFAFPKTGAYYAEHFLASAFYVHNLVYGFPSVINIPAWSLEIEIQFYCLVPVLAYYFAWRSATQRRLALLGFMAALGIVQVMFLSSSPRASLSLLYWLQYFLAGFLVADLYLTDWQKIPQHWLWEAVTLPLWLWIFLSESPWFQAVMPFLVVLVFVAAFKGPLQRRFFGNAWISMIGGMCYSLYLTHSLVLTGMERLFAKFGAPALAIWLLSLLAVLAFGTLFYWAVERPCMDPLWPKRLWRRFFPAAVATTDAAV